MTIALIKIGLTPAERQRRVIEPVLRKYGITIEELRSRYRFPELTEARIEIARLLDAENFTTAQIARALGKAQRTVQYYLTEAALRSRRRRSAEAPILNGNLLRFIELQAGLRGMSRIELEHEWALERARAEITAREGIAA